ncbi:MULTISPECIES: AraC family transcriptional regulator [unclassified Rhizobium]|uniref:AraC family transcriptional regulator n=1 Tax=unclassified Rhizobium TaxID=2613769 RepID=UPI0021F69EBE|nr:MULTISPECIES: AraC family transcriptional regulator [unclassified Rhizobium]MCV9944704.1 AraC family transcriptional regulator [Rhizobium sp. BT-175]MCW0018338.1 AraC family transcriptional regulator [Rhizobium sp. BT-226]
MTTDPFSDILKLARAETLVTGGFTAGGPWAIRFPVPKTIKFFAVVKGGCWVTLDGEAPIRFATGDVGLLSAPRAFVLASDPDVSPVDAMTLFSGVGRTTAQLGDGDDFAHVGGHVLLDPVSGRLLADVLPPWIHVRASLPAATTFRWLLDRLVEERRSDLPGAELASAQLAQLLFIQILRAHLAGAHCEGSGWLRALSDPRIAPALRLMHEDPARAWHLEDLAAACSMSRTTFADRFRTVAGVAPLAYLTQWRMRLAEQALRDEAGKSVALIARSVGYTSESAFSNAFKRVAGKSPKSYRDDNMHKRSLTQVKDI